MSSDDPSFPDLIDTLDQVGATLDAILHDPNHVVLRTIKHKTARLRLTRSARKVCDRLFRLVSQQQENGEDA